MRGEKGERRERQERERKGVFLLFFLFCAFASLVLWLHLIIRKHFFIRSTIIPIIVRHFANPDFTHVNRDFAISVSI